MQQDYLLLGVLLIASLSVVDGLLSVPHQVRSRGNSLWVSTSTQGNSMASVGQATVTVDTGSTNKLQNEPLDYSHVAGERDPEAWQTSITPRRDVVYGPALQAQMDMVRHLGMKEVDIDDRFKLKFSNVKQARIANMQYEGGRFRKVRLTYFDAGPNVQVGFSRELRLHISAVIVLTCSHFLFLYSPLITHRYSMLYGCRVLSMTCRCLV